MPWDLIDGKSTLVQLLAWCSQATSHYLSNLDLDLCHHMASCIRPNHNGLTVPMSSSSLLHVSPGPSKLMVVIMLMMYHHS